MHAYERAFKYFSKQKIKIKSYKQSDIHHLFNCAEEPPYSDLSLSKLLKKKGNNGNIAIPHQMGSRFKFKWSCS
jgi:hypothetical protein